MGLLEIAAASHPGIQKLLDTETGRMLQPANFSLQTIGLDGLSVEKLSKAFSRLWYMFSKREFDFESRQSDKVIKIAKDEGLSKAEFYVFECWVISFCTLLTGLTFEYNMVVWHRQRAERGDLSLPEPEAKVLMAYVGFHTVARLYKVNGAPMRLKLPTSDVLTKHFEVGQHQSFEENYLLLEKAAGFKDSKIRKRELIERFDSVYASVAI